MKMKKYTATSISEAMKRIRQDLGDDAVILNSKVVTTKKWFGIVKKKHFEVVAGIDQVEPKYKPMSSFSETTAKAPKIQATSQQPSYLAPTSNVHKEHSSQSAPIKSSNNDYLTTELKKEILDLKKMMQGINNQSLDAQYSEALKNVLAYFKEQEIDSDIIMQLADSLHTMSKEQDLSEQQLMLKAKEFMQLMLADLPFSGLDYSKKIVHVLGPTGVGKTTTIAKMAARAVLEQKKKIGFITTDTYRIAAIEQLKTYAGLLQAPVEIVYSHEDYKAAIDKLKHLDLIFIDTAGRNYKEIKYVEDLKQLIEFGENAQSYLVLSLTAKQKDLEVIIDKFMTIPIEKFIFTKVDETNSIGTMFNLMIKYKKGLAYYTNGQEVPEDIEQANLNKLLEMFFQGES